VIEENNRRTESIKKGTEKILLVDDEIIVLDVTKALLTHLEYKVLTARNGKAAITLYQENRDIDLVVLDMIMPNMQGGEFFDSLRKINPTIIVLLSSGYSLDGQAQKIMERGCNGFIQKPFNITEFSLKVREVLDK
jgi:CheY-like chemotaxis protein